MKSSSKARSRRSARSSRASSTYPFSRRDPACMKLPCDRCRKAGRRENPVFFTLKGEKYWKGEYPYFFSELLPGVFVLEPIDEVTLDKKAEHAVGLRILISKIGVECARCLGIGQADDISLLLERWKWEVTPAKDGCLEELLSHLSEDDRRRLKGSWHKAICEYVSERERKIRPSSEAEMRTFVGARLSRGQPKRHALKRLARELLAALKVKYEKRHPPPRIERLRLEVGRFLVQIRLDMRPSGLLKSVQYNSRLVDKVRDIIRK